MREFHKKIRTREGRLDGRTDLGVSGVQLKEVFVRDGVQLSAGEPTGEKCIGRDDPGTVRQPRWRRPTHRYRTPSHLHMTNDEMKEEEKTAQSCTD